MERLHIFRLHTVTALAWLGVILSAFEAGAARSCLELMTETSKPHGSATTQKQFTYSIHENLQGKSREYSLQFVDDFLKSIAKLDAILPDDLLTPSRLHLRIRDSLGVSRFKEINSDSVEIELAVPVSFKSLSRREFQRHLLSMALHEYGHGILIQTYPRLFSNLTQNKSTVDLLFLKGYEEFFADLVAVIFTGNSNAIRDAMLASGETVETSSIRSFSDKKNLEGWAYMGSYGLLAPSRKHLEPHIQQVTDKGLFLSKVLEAMNKSIVQERALLLERLTPGIEYLELELNPEQINRRFIKILESTLPQIHL